MSPEKPTMNVVPRYEVNMMSGLLRNIWKFLDKSGQGAAGIQGFALYFTPQDLDH